MRRPLLVGLFLSLCAWVGGTLAEPVSAASTPTKMTFMVPMRDGIHLATDILLPAGAGPWPVALARTPYDKRTNASTGIPLSNRAQFAQNSIVLVVQDTRGRSASEGKPRPYLDDGWGTHQDGFDTVAWIRQQSWCNGKVAGFGRC